MFLVLAAVLPVAGMANREEITRLMAVNSMFDEDKIVGNFSNMGELFHSVNMPRPDGAVALPEAGPIALPAGTDDWIAAHDITGLVALKDGALVQESYYLGTGAEDRRISWSVAKSFLAALIGIYLDTGAIASLDDPVTAYAPALIGSAHERATIRNVLNMASGVAFDEDYLAFSSDINRMGRVIALGQSLDDFTAGLTETAGPPGAAFQYVSIDTHVLGMVLRGATGASVPELMNRHILGPLGLESEPYYLTDGGGVAFVLGGLNMTTRDYARFGQLILQEGRWQGAQLVPANWVAEMTAESAPRAPGATGPRYGFQWWLPEAPRPGEVFARGVYGQYIWIDRAARVVVAINAADRGFLEPGVHAENVNRIRALVEAAR